MQAVHTYLQRDPRCQALNVILMRPLVIHEIAPLVVGQFLGQSTVAHVGVVDLVLLAGGTHLPAGDDAMQRHTARSQRALILTAQQGKFSFK